MWGESTNAAAANRALGLGPGPALGPRFCGDEIQKPGLGLGLGLGVKQQIGF